MLYYDSIETVDHHDLMLMIQNSWTSTETYVDAGGDIVVTAPSYDVPASGGLGVGMGYSTFGESGFSQWYFTYDQMPTDLVFDTPPFVAELDLEGRDCPVDRAAAREASRDLYAGSATALDLINRAAQNGVGINIFMQHPSGFG